MCVAFVRVIIPAEVTSDEIERLLPFAAVSKSRTMGAALTLAVRNPNDAPTARESFFFHALLI